MQKIVRFFDTEMRASESESMEVEGYALKFDNETQIGSQKWGFKEKISRNAFNGADISNVVLNFNHSFDNILARTTNGSLQLTVDDAGLKITARIVDTSIGRDVYRLIQDGLINRMSFQAIIKESVWTIAEKDEGTDLREITAFDRFFDVSAVTFPAYEDTSIAARSDFVVVDNDVIQHFENQETKKYKEQIKRLDQILGGK